MNSSSASSPGKAESADIVIIGAGLIGLCTAYELAKKKAGRILVLEKAASVATGSTGSSSACLRLRYSRKETMQLALFGQSAYQNWSEYCRAKDPRAAMRQVGVLWMLGEDRDTVEDEGARMRSIGAAAEVLGADEVHTRFPAVSLCSTAVDFEHGHEHDCNEAQHFLFESEGGYCTDPAGANQDLLDACRREGVDVRFGSPVTAVHTRVGAVQGVTVAGSGRINAGQVVNAAGPWCNQLNDLVGLEHEWALTPTRIQVMLRAMIEPLDTGLPMIGDAAGGIYFRPESGGNQILVGSIRASDEQEVVADPDDFRIQIDEEHKLRMLHGLHHRLPGLVHRGSVTGLAGLYTMNTQDVHPILGATHVEGFYVSNGYSGHGFKLGPAVGNLLSQVMTGLVSENDVQIDHDFLSIDRTSLAVRAKSVLA